MAKPMPTQINCPQCGQPFSAILEQILDTRLDPTAKERLLTGRVNVIACPHCGYRGMVGTPLMYHDHAKQMAIVHVPMELNIPETERERIVGTMTQAVMRSLAEDAPKGYLLQPRVALTLQGMVDQILEADGITQDMLEAERRKAMLINDLATASPDQQDALIAENQDLIDLTFFEMLGLVAQNASAAGEARASLALLNLRKKLIETTEIGQEIKAREDALRAASQELQALGQNLTRESFVDLLVNSADDDYKSDAFGTLGRALLDYQTFQLVTERIDNAQSDAERDRLVALRDKLLRFAAEYEREQQAVVQRAADTLRMLVSAPDIKAAIQNNLERIDDTFLQVLQVNLEEARRAGNVDISNRLRLIREEILRLLQASAPPEIRLINELLSVEDEQAAIAMLHERMGEINPDVVDVMDELSAQLHEAGNTAAAHRLERLAAEARSLV